MAIVQWLATVGLALLALATTVGVWRSAFTKATQTALAVGGVLVLEAVLNALLWLIATDPDNAFSGQPRAALAVLCVLLVATPLSFVFALRRRRHHRAA